MRIFIGFDPREADAFAVCRHSIARRASKSISIQGLVLDKLKAAGLYTRPMEIRSGTEPVMWDVLSDAPMSTQHANARFLVGVLAYDGWVVFMDGDILCRGDICEMFEQLDDRYALYCVKHNHVPDAGTKMDGQIQTAYPRKNWSSVFALNVGHPANRALTVDLVNSVPGRQLHGFCWLEDEQIGDLAPEWNYLVGVSASMPDPRLVHFTLGVPSMRGYGRCEYADEWRNELLDWASNEGRVDARASRKAWRIPPQHSVSAGNHS